MRIAVLGAGIVGVTTAWYLAEDGHEVTVVDKADRIAGETSFANAGIIAPGDAAAWASPEAIGILFSSLFKTHAAFKLRFSLDPHFLAWGLKFLANCTWDRHRRNTRAKLVLSLYSRDQTLELERHLGLDYGRNRAGALYLHHDRADLEKQAAGIDRLKEFGLSLRFLEPSEIRQVEPALSAEAEAGLAGALHGPDDFSGDCRAFALALAEQAQSRHGVVFRLGETVTGLDSDGGTVRAVLCRAGEEARRLECDAVVVSLGPQTPILLRTLGASAPITPVKGYSLTFPLREGGVAPITCGVDEHHFAAYSRLGDRLRLTARAEFAGYDRAPRPEIFAEMRRIGAWLFPDAADFDAPLEWTCLRPVTPAGPPIIGRAPGAWSNLWINSGHGSLGWTMGAGSSRILADLVAGRRPELDPADLCAA